MCWAFRDPLPDCTASTQAGVVAVGPAACSESGPTHQDGTDTLATEPESKGASDGGGSWAGVGVFQKELRWAVGSAEASTEGLNTDWKEAGKFGDELSCL